MKILNAQTPVIIQWHIEGKADEGTRYIAPFAFSMNGEPTQKEEIFDSFSVSTLYNMGALTDEELTILSVLMTFDETIFPFKITE